VIETSSPLNGSSSRRLLPVLLLVLVGLGLAVGAALHYRYRWLTPPDLHATAQHVSPERAEVLYTELSQRLPEIEEYCTLWSAEAAMPSVTAAADLRAVIDYRPHSPAAREAHILLARHYAEIGSPEAEEAYRAALDLADDLALRLEFARYLEGQEARAEAYEVYRGLLGEREDAFAGMRRNGVDALVVAEDLINATYFSDALETLRKEESEGAILLRARALAGLGQDPEALEAYQQWLQENPDDDEARLGLAEVVAGMGDVEEALTLYRDVDSADSRMAQAALLWDTEPDEAIRLYEESPYPVAWWEATALLEAEGRLTETLPLYTKVAESDAYFADDAAYRLGVLAQRLEKDDVYSQSQRLLAAQGLNWLALRADAAPSVLGFAPSPGVAAADILAKAAALEQVGRPDLALQEITMAASLRPAVSAKVALAQALTDRGEVVQAQAVARDYIDDHPRAPLALWRLSYPQPYGDAVMAVAARYRLDPLLLWSVMRQESLYDREATSWVGARGLMQLMPATQDWIAEEMGVSLAPGDAFDADTNIELAGWLLRWLLDYYDDDVELALAGYNGGATAVDSWLADPQVSDRDDLLRWIGYGETREYLEHVGLNYWVYQQLYSLSPSATDVE
jgi:soluble lytic murein transglycosylase